MREQTEWYWLENWVSGGRFGGYKCSVDIASELPYSSRRRCERDDCLGSKTSKRKFVLQQLVAVHGGLVKKQLLI